MRRNFWQKRRKAEKAGLELTFSGQFGLSLGSASLCSTDMVAFLVDRLTLTASTTSLVTFQTDFPFPFSYVFVTWIGEMSGEKWGNWSGDGDSWITTESDVEGESWAQSGNPMRRRFLPKTVNVHVLPHVSLWEHSREESHAWKWKCLYAKVECPFLRKEERWTTTSLLIMRSYLICYKPILDMLQ